MMLYYSMFKDVAKMQQFIFLYICFNINPVLSGIFFMPESVK
ncbi:hypothetical protein SCB49_04455 [unidentified eubacterium SCB49]|nr:hypothetical protein SCB49_04455 [unidentified eubacterium SCB49]